MDWVIMFVQEIEIKNNKFTTMEGSLLDGRVWDQRAEQEVKGNYVFI